MNLMAKILIALTLCVFMSSCVSKQKYTALQTKHDAKSLEFGECDETKEEFIARLSASDREKARLKGEMKSTKEIIKLREEQIQDLKAQIEDMRSLQEGALSPQEIASNNRVVTSLMRAKKAKKDMSNAVAEDLRKILNKDISNNSVEVVVDKSAIQVNLSDQLLYASGSSRMTPKAIRTFGKIAKILEARPNLDVMIEGHTDNTPIKSSKYYIDNWDLSVKRATSVVRLLQRKYKISPDRLIATGRGEYVPVASNDNATGRGMNRRTRIVIIPKVDPVYQMIETELRD